MEGVVRVVVDYDGSGRSSGSLFLETIVVGREVERLYAKAARKLTSYEDWRFGPPLDENLATNLSEGGCGVISGHYSGVIQ